MTKISNRLLFDAGVRPGDILSHQDPERLLRTPEAAVFLGVCRQHLYKLIKQGEVTPFRVGREQRFRRADLIAYRDRHTKQLEQYRARPSSLDNGESDHD
jgi:excisionase family DNA binding protein